MVALLKFTQGPNTADFGIAVAGTQDDGANVLCENSDGGVVTYKLASVPPGSGLVAGSSIATAPTATFAWDVPGTYQVEAYIGGALQDRRDFVIPNAHGYLVPSAGSTDATFNLLGATTGWTTAVNAILHAVPEVGTVDDVVRGDGSVGAVPHGAYHARHAATTHWYKCDDASGDLVNSIAGAAVPLAVSGGAIYADPGLFFHGTRALRTLSTFEPSYAESGDNAASIDPSSGLSIEATFDSGCLTEAVVLQVFDGAAAFGGASGMQIAVNFAGDPGVSAVFYSSAGVLKTVDAISPDFALSRRHHVLVTYNPEDPGAALLPNLKLYIDGTYVGSMVCGTITTLTDIAIGGPWGGGAGLFSGLIADVRITRAVLDLSYARAATIAMGLL